MWAKLQQEKIIKLKENEWEADMEIVMHNNHASLKFTSNVNTKHADRVYYDAKLFLQYILWQDRHLL